MRQLTKGNGYGELGNLLMGNWLSWTWTGFLKVFDGGYTRATAPGLLTLLVSLVASMPTKALKAEK